MGERGAKGFNEEGTGNQITDLLLSVKSSENTRARRGSTLRGKQ